jgi:hypothetical protein
MDRRGDALERRGAEIVQQNMPGTSRCVAPLITTVSAAATASRRAAMFVVSPRASTSLLAPPPIAPITTGPVWTNLRPARFSCLQEGQNIYGSQPLDPWR